MTNENTGIDALAADIVAELDPKAYPVEAVMTNITPVTFLEFVKLVLAKVETVGGYDLSEYEDMSDDDDDDDDDFWDGDNDDDDRWPGDTDDDDEAYNDEE